MAQNRIYVDGISGVTSAPGTEAQPVRTLSQAAAIAQTVSGTTPGDIIVVGTGIYREQVNLPVNKNLTFYARGMAIIDGENIRYCAAVAQTGTATPVAALFTNFIMRNGLNNRCIDVEATPTVSTSVRTVIVSTECIAYGSGSGYTLTPTSITTLSPVSIGAINTAFYYDTYSASNAVVKSAVVSGSEIITYLAASPPGEIFTATGGILPCSYFFDHCTVVNCGTVTSFAAPSSGHFTSTGVYGYPFGTRVEYAYSGTNYFAYGSISETTTIRSCLCKGVTSYTPAASTLTNVPYLCTAALYAPTVTATYNAAPGTPNADHVTDTTAHPPPFTSEVFPDPDLSLNYSGTGISYYLGTGYKGSNIGATWYPAFGQWMAYNDLPTALKFVTNWTDPVSGDTWASDTNYPDGATKGSVIWIDDANGNHVEIDTVAQPSATSGAAVSPVYKVVVRSGSTGNPRRRAREATEDTTLAAGLKKVIDSTLGDATRTTQFRAALAASVFTKQQKSTADGGTGPNWTDIGFLDDTITTFTSTFYYQLRDILTIAGE